MAGRTGQVRIIGGKWKGRKLRFPSVAGLRPAPSRLRETLFNWLGDAIVGARCLDLCAGSGALGLESLSRGAASVEFVERNRRVCSALEDSIRELGASADIQCKDAKRFLVTSIRNTRCWDVVFLDPPFASAMHDELLPMALACLRDADARLCLKCPGKFSPRAGNWRPVRRAGAGDSALWLVALLEGRPSGS